MDFPAEPAVECAPPDDLAKPLGSEILWCGQNRMDILVQIANEQAIRNLAPDLSCLARLGTRGVIVTAISENGPADFVSRFFCPSLGIDEDPVTGSAHCCLAPFWAERIGCNELVGFQASRRGGFVRCTLAGDRVLLGGQAVTILSGEMVAPPPGT